MRNLRLTVVQIALLCAAFAYLCHVMYTLHVLSRILWRLLIFVANPLDSSTLRSFAQAQQNKTRRRREERQRRGAGGGGREAARWEFMRTGERYVFRGQGALLCCCLSLVSSAVIVYAPMRNLRLTVMQIALLCAAFAYLCHVMLYVTCT